MKSPLLLQLFSSALLAVSFTAAGGAMAQDNHNTTAVDNTTNIFDPRYIADFSDSALDQENRQNNMDSALEDNIDTEDIWDADGNDILNTDATSVDVDNIDLDILINKGQVVFKNGAGLLQASSHTSLRVAVLLPLTGANARYGQDILSGIEKAVFQYNKPGLALQVYDTKSTIAATKTAYLQAKSMGSQVILGPLLARSAYEIAKQAVADKIPLISFTNNTLIARKGVYVMGQLPENSVSISAKYAFKHKHTGSYKPRFAVIAPKGSYGDILVQALTKTATELGTIVSRNVRYDTNSNMNQIAYTIAKGSNRLRTVDENGVSVNVPFRSSQYDILLVVGPKKHTQSLVVALPYYDLDLRKVQIIGTQRWHTSWVAKEPTLSGTIVSYSDDEALDQFNSQFKALYNHDPISLASLGYDAYGMLATISENKDLTDMNKYITNASGYNGTFGIFRFLNNGRVQRSLAVYRVVSHRFKKIQKPENILK